MTSKDTCGEGLNYEEDNDGNIFSVTPCSYMPSPPTYTGLELSSLDLGCGENSSDSFVLECSGGECATDTWPVCDDDTTEEVLVDNLDTTWEYADCQEVNIDYLNKTVSCGQDGWKTGRLVTKVGKGVFTDHT